MSTKTQLIKLSLNDYNNLNNYISRNIFNHQITAISLLTTLNKEYNENKKIHDSLQKMKIQF